MASAGYSEDLTCAVCLTVFTDPVNLPCGHSFCRQCISGLLRPQCPLCQTSVPADATCLPTSHTLTRLAEKAREEKIQEKQMAQLCPEHEEKLKLFCVTDQQLACIICRDGEKHEGHKFKPIKEAAASLRRELEKGAENLCDDILTAERRANAQRDEIRKTRETSQQLTTRICRQFEEMHQFLRKREDEVKNELKLREEEAVEEMTKALNVMEAFLSESRELQEKVTSALSIEEPERFLLRWTEGDSVVPSGPSPRPRADDLTVEKCTLSLGPYESHLQFFVWKEMLQVIQPRAELLSLTSNSTQMTVSDDGRSLFATPESSRAQSAASTFGSGSAYNRGKPLGLFGSSSSLALPKSQGFSFATSSGFDQHQSSSIFGVVSSSGQSRSSSFGVVSSFAQSTSSSFGTTVSFSQHQSSLFGQSTISTPVVCVPARDQSESSVTFGQTAFSVDEFSSGQHYWEVEVGQRDYWELGIVDHFLKYDGHIYATSGPKATTELALEGRPRKVGVYLNLSSKRISFYDAGSMTHIHSMSCAGVSPPLAASFSIRSTAPDPNPLTVCWY